MLIIPAIDICEGKCVRLINGDFTRKKIYADDPVLQAKKWIGCGAKMLHIVDLDGARIGKLENWAVTERIIRNIDIPVEIAGGIRKEKDIQNILRFKNTKAVISSLFYQNENMAIKIIRKYPGRILIALDLYGDNIMTRGWFSRANGSIGEAVEKINRLPVTGIIFTDINRDGLLSGIDYPKIKNIMEKIKKPVIVSGGVSGKTDLAKIAQLKAYGVIIGKALYENKMNLQEMDLC